MKKFLGVSLVVGVLAVLVAVVVAHEHRGYGIGMGPRMGRAMMGGRGMWASTTQITEQKANELAQQYADKNLAGFKVERVLPSTGMPHTMYSVELKSPKGELRTLHVTPFGGVMPFGPLSS